LIADLGDWGRSKFKLQISKISDSRFGNAACQHAVVSDQTSQADQLQERLIAFAVSIVEISAQLPRTQNGRHISNQILRSGTATAANYGEARAAESRSDFVHKLRIVLKELNETAVWLQVIARSALVRREKVVAVIAENQELCRILGASVRTARGSE
jgi:four helix bundle protein